MKLPAQLVKLKTHFIIVVLLSIAMLVCSAIFSVNEFLHHPQFTEYKHFDYYVEMVVDNTRIWQVMFFVLDFIWAPLLLLLLLRWIMYFKDRQEGNIEKAWRLYKWYILFSAAALLLDYTENILYLSRSKWQLSWVVSYKYFFYILAAIVFLYFLYQHKLHDYREAFIKFLKASFLSILVILIIGLLLTKMPQGGSVVIRLMESPVSLALSVILVNLLAVILSHYPVYFEARQSGNTHGNNTVWKMDEGWNFLGFGLIYYRYTGDVRSVKIKLFRHQLGLLTYVAFLYVFLFAFFNFYQIGVSPSLIAGIVYIILAIIYFVIYKSRYHKNEDKNKHQLIRFFPYLLAISIVLLILTVVLSITLCWHWLTIVFFILTIISFALTYVFFRIFRSGMKDVFPGKGLRNEIFDDKKASIHVDQDSSGLWAFMQLGKLSDNIIYLKIQRIFIVASLFILLLINFWDDLNLMTNPLNILALYLIFYYSIIVFVLKHILFYSRAVIDEESRLYKYRHYRFLLPNLFIALLAISYYASKKGNDLHLISMTKETQELIDVERYKQSIPNNNYLDKPFKTRFYLASSGGGLKANLWTMLILNKLQEKTKGDFFNACNSLSGASGGSIGLGNYTAMWATKKDLDIDTRLAEISSTIDEIALKRYLSIDLTYLLGRDYIREYLPMDIFNGRDRSYCAMKQYAEHCGMGNNFNDITFRSFYATTFDSLGYYPPLIINATSTTGIRGVAFSLKDQTKKVFAGSKDVLDVGNADSSITYYGALSTSNRFPLFSPTARVRSQGHFLDGGYFDNSGLLSSRDFYTYLKVDTLLRSVKDRCISLINDKSEYIQYRLSEWGIQLDEERAEGELSSILSTLISIDKLPYYIHKKLEQDKSIFSIYLPYTFTFAEAIDKLGGSPKDPVYLVQRIEKNNEQVINVLCESAVYNYKKWGLVETPLARLLSKPDIQYQKAMLANHPEVKRVIDEIIDENW